MTACIPSLGLPGQVLSACVETAVLSRQTPIAPRTFRATLDCPRIAREIGPGQFFMLRAPHRSDPLLGRPFALLDIVRNAHGEPTGLDFGYSVVGRFTTLLSTLTEGSPLEIWGPLGNGFPVVDTSHLAIVAGGIGQTPFVAVIREALGCERYGQSPRAVMSSPPRITVCYGARTASAVAGMEWFSVPGVTTRIATDDGSLGTRGFVTTLLDDLLASDDPPTAVYCCGPEPMMHAVAQRCLVAGVPAWLSLETPMACGIGACFSCVARIRQPDGSWDYQRTCVEGPVFPADKVVFEGE